MKLEYYPVSRLKKEVREIVDRYLDLDKHRLFFFGSRVRGDNFPRADIDVGIEGRGPLAVGVAGRIKEDLERIRTLYKFDLVDFGETSSSFRDEALKYTEEI